MKHQPALFALCVVLLAGCSLPTISALTPEQAAQQGAIGIGGKPKMVGRRTQDHN